MPLLPEYKLREEERYGDVSVENFNYYEVQCGKNAQSALDKKLITEADIDVRLVNLMKGNLRALGLKPDIELDMNLPTFQRFAQKYGLQ